MKLHLLLLVLLLAPLAYADQLYLLTIIDGKVTSQMVSGYAPQVFDGATYAVKDASGATLSTGHYAYPSAMMMEKFHEDNTIEGDSVAVPITVIIPAVDGAAKVDVMDLTGKVIGTADVSSFKTTEISFDDPEDLDSSGFWLKYGYMILALVILVVIIVGIVFGVKFLRRKKKTS